MTQGNITDEELAALIRRTEEANAAFMRGDTRRYATLITHSDDYTLMAPFGGAPTRGFDDSSERLAELARYFRAGTSVLELVQSYVSGETWWFLRSSNGSMARSVVYRIRTGRYASPWSFAVKDRLAAGAPAR